jgi:hypothetical protein
MQYKTDLYTVDQTMADISLLEEMAKMQRKCEAEMEKKISATQAARKALQAARKAFELAYAEEKLLDQQFGRFGGAAQKSSAHHSRSRSRSPECREGSTVPSVLMPRQGGCAPGGYKREQQAPHECPFTAGKSPLVCPFSASCKECSCASIAENSKGCSRKRKRQ